MFTTIYTYELKHWLKKPIVYIFYLVFFGMALLAFVGNSGVLDGVSATGTSARILNSEYEINGLIQYFNKFLLFLLPAILGNAFYKDFRRNTHHLLYSFPLTKGGYLWGKFLSGFTLITFIASSVIFALIIAAFLPIYPKDSMLPFQIMRYLKPFFMYSFTNLFFYGIFITALVVLFRNIYAGFIGVIILLFIQNISQNVFDGNGFFIGLFDPLGNNTTSFLTHEWNLSAKNTRGIPTFGLGIYNRLFWGALAGIIGFYTLKIFSFRYHAIFYSPWFRSYQVAKKAPEQFLKEELNITYAYGFKQELKAIWNISNFHFRFIYRSRMFYVLIVLGLFAVSFSIGRITNAGEIVLLPLTNMVLTIPAFFFSTISMLITFIYSGMLIHRELMGNCNHLVDATAARTSTLYLSKVLALLKMQCILLTVMLVAGIGLQAYNGYTNFELDLYLSNLFFIQFSGLMIWAFASVFLHSLTRNVYLGIFLLLLGWIGVSGAEQIGITSKLLLFNFATPLPYSDLSGYNGALVAFFLVKAHWLCFSIILLILGYLWYHRGYLSGFKESLLKMKLRINWAVRILGGMALVGFICAGYAIYQGEQGQISSKTEDLLFKDFERRFKKYRHITNQPIIQKIYLDAALYPHSQAMEIKGHYQLFNHTSKNIDTLLIKNGFQERTHFSLNTAYEIVDKSDFVQFYVVKLKEPLAPKDSISLTFQLQSDSGSLFKNTSRVLHNGTFIKNNVFPRLGYFLDDTLYEPHMPKARYSSYHGQNAHMTSIETKISTSSDQIAIAPGKLLKSWKANNRNHYHYKTEKPVRNAVSLHSGDFELKKKKWGHIALEMYLDAKHKFNVDRMMNGLKTSLAFNSKYFGPFQYDEARIVEFPMIEGSYATAMANNIPTSEMRFIANSDVTKNKVDLSFYVIAHETTHHWFGKQLSPAKAKGATMLTESISEYISLQLYEAQYGKEKAIQFLRKQQERYWEGSLRENTTEPPLYLALPSQQYITYGKGAIAFNALGNRIGHHKLLDILGAFLNQYRYQMAPYPTTTDFLLFLKERISPSHWQLVQDYFERVTLFETQIIGAEMGFKDGTHQVTVAIRASKKIKGQKKAKPLQQDIELGFYTKKGKCIRLETFSPETIEVRKQFTLTEKPYLIVVDPHLLLLEKDTQDNRYNF
ncbi:ABC transporter permease/M1 family aminopeptidase [Spongiimicrobium salis]|uniref:ABC transporter permease/M1 family aminopeptidase n=1 Tax=Spongiimicrobium salis TaxID=1667022 RepID=UPI00374DB260